MWKFRKNICRRQRTIFSKRFYAVIQVDERNQRTKFYLGNINITSFIKVLRNAPHPPRRSQKGPKNEKLTQKQKRNCMGAVTKGGEITFLFSITPLFHKLWAFEISKFSKIARILINICPTCE